MSPDPATELKQLILELTRYRGPHKSICPSEVARAYADNWRPWMQAVRSAAQELVGEGAIVVLQKGVPVDLARVRGPVRLRIVENSHSRPPD